MESDPTLPSTEDVIRKTEQITKNIQELLRAAQENKHDRSESAKRVFMGLGSAVFISSSLCSPRSSSAHEHASFMCGLCVSPAISHDALLSWLFTTSLCSTLPPCYHVLVSWCRACPSPLWADHVSVKVCVGSGTASDVSAHWCPGPRRPPLPSSHSVSGPLTPPPGTLASVPASQAQFIFHSLTQPDLLFFSSLLLTSHLFGVKPNVFTLNPDLI